jgi:hypothetical protein
MSEIFSVGLTASASAEGMIRMRSRVISSSMIAALS